MSSRSWHVSEHIDRPPAEVYAFAAQPANLARWAPGLGTSVVQDDGQWFVDTPAARVRLDFAPRFSELRVDPEGFNRFLRAGFAQKRKTLANNLRSAGYEAADILRAWPHDLPAQIRAEAVSLESMAELYRSLGSYPAGTGRPVS